MQKRDINILKSFQREIKMNQSTIKSKKLYSRKEKHKAISLKE